MPESIPASLIIDTLKDTFREARAWLAAEVAAPPRHPHLGWILSVPDTHQRTVLAALDKEQAIRVLTCATEDEATTTAAGLWLGGGVGRPPCSWAWRRSDAEARGRARRDRRRAGRRDLRADDDHRARLAHAGAGRPLGHVRGLHGRRFGAGPGAGARVSLPPRRRVRRRRIAPDAARVAGDDRGRPAAEPHPPRLQERRLPHLGRAGHSRRARRGLRGDGEGRRLPQRLRDQGAERLQAAPAYNADGRGTGARRALHGPCGEDADDRPGRPAVPPAGGDAQDEAPRASWLRAGGSPARRRRRRRRYVPRSLRGKTIRAPGASRSGARCRDSEPRRSR